MNRNYSIRRAFGKALKLLSFTIIPLLIAQVAVANLVIGYTPSCVTAGQSLTIGVNTTTTYTGTWFHWQYRVNTAGAAPGPWTFLSGVADGSPVNNTINGTVFAVSNANITSPSNNYSFNLVISNSTTALNEVEFRVLVGPFGDPEVLATPVWNGDDQNIAEARTVRVRIKPTTENCFSGCADNILVLNPPSGPATPMEEFYGGFEAASNFGLTNPNGSSVTAQTDYTQWTSGVPGTNTAGVVNNAYSMIWLSDRFAPHTGRNMLVVNQSDNITSKVWFKKLVAASSPSQQYFGGQIVFRLWASKTSAGGVPCFAMELKGTDMSNNTVVLNSLPVTMTATAGQPGYAPGDWVQYSLTYLVPAGIYKELEASVRGNCTTGNNFAIDDICLVTPSAAILPVRLTTLSAAYADGVTKLGWATDQEINSSYFEIEHSSTGTDFKSLGRVNAAGYSGSRKQYFFDDVKTPSGINYYRLKIVDKDGSFEYSNIVSAKVIIKGTILAAVYPNPFADRVQVSIASDKKETAVLRLYDNTGRMLVSQTNVINKGVTLININNLQKLSKGFYILEVKTAETVFTQKIIK